MTFGSRLILTGALKRSVQTNDQAKPLPLPEEAPAEGGGGAFFFELEVASSCGPLQFSRSLSLSMSEIHGSTKRCLSYVLCDQTRMSTVFFCHTLPLAGIGQPAKVPHATFAVVLAAVIGGHPAWTTKPE